MDARRRCSRTAQASSPLACPECTNNLNHAVNIVGWALNAGQAYWKVRNSWGTSGGEKGYFRIIRGKGSCGLNAAVVFPLSIRMSVTVTPSGTLPVVLVDHVAADADGVSPLSS